MHIRLLERDSALQMITQAQTRKDCVWVFTNGLVHDNLGGATAIFADEHGPFGATSLRFPLGPFQSTIDAELAGIRGALLHLLRSQAWSCAIIVTESQAALRMI